MGTLFMSPTRRTRQMKDKCEVITDTLAAVLSLMTPGQFQGWCGRNATWGLSHGNLPSPPGALPSSAGDELGLPAPTPTSDGT